MLVQLPILRPMTYLPEDMVGKLREIYDDMSYKLLQYWSNTPGDIEEGERSAKEQGYETQICGGTNLFVWVKLEALAVSQIKEKV